MKSHFRNIGLIGRVDSEAVVASIRQLVELLDSRHLKVILEEQTSRALGGHSLQVASRKSIGEACDLVIVVGGDGSLLGAARDLARHDVPVLGINRGKLGFLTDIAADNVADGVGKVLDGEYREEERFLLDMQLKRDGAVIESSLAFNDVVLHSGQAPKMLSFELHIEGEFVYSQRSDGLIVASPTGSTAYSLSGGGPIMHPRLNAIVLVPMFPHTLSSRPLVIDGNSEIKVIIADTNPENPRVSCDGQVNVSARPGDVIYINKSAKRINLLHPQGHVFYATCRNKLGWGSQFIGN
ncbi:MAG: NAD(+) kinase [Gammaproteobacteria bacterium]|nr:NAD(+) kinase [Gammaproteobacteria bacterium]MBT8152206.1 NAD(+) kinase [Gammaproteobacteria bacterium]NND39822.1 NAD(+) kinase [Pseudomonadales bacterium]NNM11172.1 NAD(+) kinase [Pseudomonadales bacterium]RZV49749.1 MAG: NAD(+) kinase [Pseudomonadales bacterium]